MPDPTPAAAPAATPAAATAPAADPSAAPASAAAPAASAAPAAPAATPTPAPAAGEGESLIDAVVPAAPVAAPQTEAEKLAAARELVKQADAAADPNSGKAWLLHEGVMGQGEKPTWFKNDKYKTVSAQAEAYVGLEKRFGSFVGAPKDGKYEFTPPEGVEVAMDHPLMQEFTKWASEAQLSQEGYTNLLGMLVQYEAAHQPDMAAIKARLGPDADTRMGTAVGWMNANLGPEGVATFKAATTGANADSVFKLVEQLIGKTGTVRVPSPGKANDGVAPTAGDALAAIKRDHGAKTPDGKLRVNVDPAYRLDIERRYREYYQAG